jgi:hypothetical protein
MRRDRRERTAELLAAVTTQRTDDITSPAFGMQPDQRCIRGCEIAVNQRDRFSTVHSIGEDERLERTETSRETCRAEARNPDRVSRLDVHRRRESCTVRADAATSMSIPASQLFALVLEQPVVTLQSVQNVAGECHRTGEEECG